MLGAALSPCHFGPVGLLGAVPDVLDELETDLCLQLGMTAADRCFGQVVGQAPLTCELTLESARAIAQNSGLPRSKCDEAALLILGQARIRWRQLLLH
jgi:hypothetical protein